MFWKSSDIGQIHSMESMHQRLVYLEKKVETLESLNKHRIYFYSSAGHADVTIKDLVMGIMKHLKIKPRYTWSRPAYTEMVDESDNSTY